MVGDVPALIKRLSLGNSAEQLAAAEAIARLGTEARPAAATLVATLRTADAATRDWCVAALEELGPPPVSQIDELMRLAGDGTLDVAYWAIMLLGRAGNDAAPAVGTLIRVLSESQESVLHERAAWALGKLGPAAKDATSALQQAATSDNPRLARLARQALGELELK